MSKNIAVFGIYPTDLDASDAVQRLRLAGFQNTDVSVLFSANVGNKDLAHEKNTKAPEGATAGAGSGAIVGGVFGWLVGAGLLAIPGLGPLIAAGPIVGLLTGVGAGGTLGGITGALIGAGMPEYEAKRYEGRVHRGGVLLSVHCDDADLEKKAKQLLANSGAQDISSTAEAKADFGASDRANPRSVVPRA